MNRRQVHFSLWAKGLLASAELLLLLIGEQGLDAKPATQAARGRPLPAERVLSVQPAAQLQPVSRIGQSPLWERQALPRNWVL
jgi:hypothetical protein